MSEREECYNVKRRRREWREEERKILIYDFNSTFTECDTGKLRPAFVTIFLLPCCLILIAVVFFWRRRSHHVVTMVLAEFLRHFRVWKWKIYSDYYSSSSDYDGRIEEKCHRNEIEQSEKFCHKNSFPISLSSSSWVYILSPK